MPKISEQKKKRISEQILYHLFSVFPKQIFTAHLASELARDEEFIKRLLLDLEKKGFVKRIVKSPSGKNYERRLRWRISNKAYNVYNNRQ